MNTETANNDDDDFFSDSNSESSITSKVGKNDELVTDMGSKPEKLLTIKYFIPNFLIAALPELTHYVELQLADRTFNVSIYFYLALIQPLCDLMSRFMPQAISSGFAIYASRNTAKQQLTAAQIYFMHALIAQTVYIALEAILYFSVLSKLFDKIEVESVVTGVLKQYFLINGLICSIINVFNYGLTPFFQCECRYFFLMCKELLHQLTTIVGMVIFIYQGDDINKGVLTLNNLAYPQLIGTCVGAILSMISINKIKILDVQYKGTLFIQMKRLSPIRWKLIFQSLWTSLPFMMLEFYEGFFEFYAVYIPHTKYFSYKQVDQILIQHVRSIAFCRSRYLLRAILTGFRDEFQVMCIYNMNTKKISRIYKTLQWTLIYSFCIVTAAVITMTFTNQYLYRLLLSYEKINTIMYYNFCYDEVSFQMKSGPWSVEIQLFSYLAICFLVCEQKTLLALIIMIPSILFVPLVQLYNYKDNGDNADYTTVIIFGDAILALFSIAVITEYFIKYKNLYEINKGSGQDHKTFNFEANEGIRKEMVEELDKEASDSSEEKRKQNSKQMNIFNKEMALRSSKQFSTLRESITSSRETISARISTTSPRIDEIKPLNVKPQPEKIIKPIGQADQESLSSTHQRVSKISLKSQISQVSVNSTIDTK